MSDPTSPVPAAPAPDDPHLWLEEVTGEQALGWVRERNAETIEELTGTESFGALEREIREVLDADDRIPYVRRRGEYLYNFWQDATHPRGLWRRTTPAEYRKTEPDWDVLLDVDALAEREGENWVWQGATVLRPGLHRCLVELSRGGADATVVREFDLESRAFVAGGFELPEAKSAVSWIDEDRIYVGTDFGPGSLTSSGYPRLVKEWRRGTPLEQASLVYEGKPDDVAVYGLHDPTEGFERDVIVRSTDFHHSELYLRTPDGPVKLDVPDDAKASVHREWLLVRTRSPWTVGGTEYPAGALLAADLEAYLAGGRELTLLFAPDAHTSLDSYSWTRNHLILDTLSDVQTRLRVLTPGPDGWRDEPLPVPASAAATISISDTDPDASDEYLVNASGFTEPSTLALGQVGGELEIMKRAPAFFDGSAHTVRQHFATSADGTRIPYFVVGRQDERPAPTLLTAYGGFELSLTPPTAGSSAAAGSPAAAPTWWPTCAAAGSTARSGTPRRCRRTGTGCTRTSLRWPRTSPRAASPPPSCWASRAAATADC